MARSWMQQQADANANRTSLLGGNSGQPFLSGIETVNVFSETVQVQFYGGQRNIKIPHPYLGLTAWHRVGPEPGMGVLMQSRVDSKDPEGFLYYLAQDRQNPANPRLSSFDQGKDTYRPVEPGEQDFSSRGNAQLFMGRRPLLELRAGAVRGWYDQDNLEHGAKAATHKFLLHKNVPGQIGDEFRVGVVQRPSATSSTSGSTTSTTNVDHIRSPSGTGFAKELLWTLDSGGGQPPKLLNMRAGDVTDDSGQTIDGEFGVALRFLEQFFNSNSNPTEAQVDTDGNVFLKLPDEASQGMKLRIPQGDFKAFVDGTSSEASWTCTGTFKASAQGDATLESTQATTKVFGSSVRLGNNNASEPILLGNTYKDAETQLMDQLKNFEDIVQTGYGSASDALQSLSGIVQAAAAAPLLPGAIFSQVMTLLINLLKAIFQVAKQSAQQKKTAYSTFTSDYSSYLSDVVRTA